MTKRLFALLLALAPGLSLAAGEVHLESSGVNIQDEASLQRGAALYANYCSGCHSLAMSRYSRVAADLNLTEEQVQANLNFAGTPFGGLMTIAMPRGDAQAWFGKTPPDLSLAARRLHGGPDYIYSFLKGYYVDETRPTGWNNTVMVGTSMPHVLWDLQGVQAAVFGASPGPGQPAPVERLEPKAEGRLSPEQYDRVARDISAYLTYVAEPAGLDRERYGLWVVLFLAGFTFLAWLLKTEYWNDVH